MLKPFILPLFMLLSFGNKAKPEWLRAENVHVNVFTSNFTDFFTSNFINVCSNYTQACYASSSCPRSPKLLQNFRMTFGINVVLNIISYRLPPSQYVKKKVWRKSLCQRKMYKVQCISYLTHHFMSAANIL